MSARDPSGLPNGPTESSRRRLLGIFPPTRIVVADAKVSQQSIGKPDKTGDVRDVPRGGP
jgi:hypothetical protein